MPVMLPSTAADIPTGDRAEQGSRPWSEPHRRVAVQGAVDQAHPGGVRAVPTSTHSLVSAAAVRCCYPMDADQSEWLPHNKFGLIRRSNRC